MAFERSKEMRNSDGMRHPRGLIIICVALLAFASLPALLSGRTQTASIKIVNNSNRVIRNVYLSHVDVEDWGGDQLSEGQTIGPGQSFNLSNVACDQSQIKVIGEDQDGCFLSGVVNCGADATWTITNDTPADCGSGN
jgi:hypothetical protein